MKATSSDQTIQVNLSMTSGGRDKLGVFKQTPGSDYAWQEFRFTVNEPMSAGALQVVLEYASEISGSRAPKGGCVYVTMEIDPSKRPLDGFLNQFDHVITARTDLEAGHLKPSVIRSWYVNGWHLQKTYDELKSTVFEKQKAISVVSSDLVLKEGHKKRFAFVNRLMGHFKDRVHVYGRGFNPIPDKNPALLPYKYSIAIENEQTAGYFTEKLTDCFLANAVPVYHGAPDIDRFFDADSMVRIDIDDPDAAIQAIERLLEEDPYDDMLPAVLRARDRILDEYQFFPWLTGLLREHVHADFSRPVCKRIRPHQFWSDRKMLRDYLYLSRMQLKKVLKNQLSR